MLGYLEYAVKLVVFILTQVPDAIKKQLTLYSAWSEWEKLSTGSTTPPLSFYPTEERTYPMLNTLGVSTISYQYAPSHNFHFVSMIHPVKSLNKSAKNLMEKLRKIITAL